MKTPEPVREFHILNLGAGVQSTALALMSKINAEHCGKYPKVPIFHAAIFGDTMEEPKYVYEHLAWLTKELSKVNIPVLVRSVGKLGDHLMNGRNSTGGRFASIPAFTKGKDPNEKEGIMRRQCTKEYKTEVVERAVRRDVLGLKPRQRVPKGTVIYQYLGLSADEPGRVARVKLRYERDIKSMFPRFPLFDMQWIRRDCEKFLAEYGIPHTVNRSACVFCPYHDDDEWIRLRDQHPEDFKRACDVDDALRKPGNVCNRNMDQKIYIHRTCVPLREAKFVPTPPGKNAKAFQTELRGIGFGNECHGMCGL